MCGFSVWGLINKLENVSFFSIFWKCLHKIEIVYYLKVWKNTTCKTRYFICGRILKHRCNFFICFIEVFKISGNYLLILLCVVIYFVWIYFVCCPFLHLQNFSFMFSLLLLVFRCFSSLVSVFQRINFDLLIYTIMSLFPSLLISFPIFILFLLFITFYLFVH